MKRITLSLLIVAVSTGALLAQSVDQGKKFLYYERYKSAREQFEKSIAANPNNLEAVYWLGQVLLDEKNPDKDAVAAKDLYQKALATNGSAPLILIGMGQIALVENNVNDAKQRFETAISLSKSKDIEVFNRVAAANVNTKAGDANYAIEKLNAAIQIKKFNDANTFLIMGDAYRKLVDGGGAITAYQKALAVDPKLAAAKYRIGKIYLTQGNKEFFIPAFEEAIQLDPAYAPALYELFIYYYYHSDVDKASEYFDKYLAVSDPGPNNDYDRTSMLYIRKKYPETIAASQDKIKTLGDKADPRYYKLIAYAYNDQGDSTNAKAFLDQYFAKQKPEGFVPMDYTFRAEVLSKFPGNEAEAVKDYSLAVAADTTYDGKLDLLTKGAALAKKVGLRTEEAGFQKQLYTMKKNPSNVDLYNLGQAYYQSKNYTVADSIFCTVYEGKYPDEIVGYLWCARSKGAEDDSLNSQGIAVDAYINLLNKAKQLDSVKYKRQILQAVFFLVPYYNDVKKDKTSALMYIDKGLETDPTNADLLRFKDILSKPPAPPRTPKTPSTTKPKPPATGGK